MLKRNHIIEWIKNIFHIIFKETRFKGRISRSEYFASIALGNALLFIISWVFFIVMRKLYPEYYFNNNRIHNVWKIIIIINIFLSINLTIKRIHDYNQNWRIVLYLILFSTVWIMWVNKLLNGMGSWGLPTANIVYILCALSVLYFTIPKWTEWENKYGSDKNSWITLIYRIIGLVSIFLYIFQRYWINYLIAS
jgi:uncharacterized membrane protein YhaH (DUF805 family)